MPTGVYERTTVPVMDRLLAKVQTDESGCWIFTGAKTKAGYGTIAAGPRQPRVYTHRVMYEHHKGTIPEGLTIDHLCRVRACCNPEHLEAVTQAENTRRAAAVLTHCVNNHEFTEENTRITRRGARSCRTCHREQERNRRHRDGDR